jgi:copper homeostasis protein
VLVEACVESLVEAVAAEQGGAGRLELCADMAVGGTTPSTSVMEDVLPGVTIPVFVMVRPRGGGFEYDAGELAIMLRDIVRAREAGAHGVVTGALREDGRVDSEAMRRLLETAHPLPVTFHRAFDATPDLARALETLLALGVDRVLTSGGAARAIDGSEQIAALVRRADSRLVVMAGGGVRADHAAALVERTGVPELHARPATGGRFDASAFRDLVRAIEA